MEENYGEVIQEQKMNILEPPSLGPGAHITTQETVGTLHHKVGHDYILEVDGKMKVKVNNNPLKKVGPLFLEMPMETLKYEIVGSRTSTLLMDPILQYSQTSLIFLWVILYSDWYCCTRTNSMVCWISHKR